MVALSKLQSLTSLNVSWTEFNRSSLEMIVEDLPLLENLDISVTKVIYIIRQHHKKILAPFHYLSRRVYFRKGKKVPSA